MEPIIRVENLVHTYGEGTPFCRSAVDGITLDTVKDLLSVDKDLWLEDCNGVEELYDQIGERVPAELRKQLADLRARLSK